MGMKKSNGKNLGGCSPVWTFDTKRWWLVLVTPILGDELLLLKAREAFPVPRTTAASHRMCTKGEESSLLGKHTRTGTWKELIFKISLLHV